MNNYSFVKYVFEKSSGSLVSLGQTFKNILHFTNLIKL